MRASCLPAKRGCSCRAALLRCRPLRPAPLGAQLARQLVCSGCYNLQKYMCECLFVCSEPVILRQLPHHQRHRGGEPPHPHPSTHTPSHQPPLSLCQHAWHLGSCTSLQLPPHNCAAQPGGFGAQCICPPPLNTCQRAESCLALCGGQLPAAAGARPASRQQRPPPPSPPPCCFTAAPPPSAAGQHAVHAAERRRGAPVPGAAAAVGAAVHLHWLWEPHQLPHLQPPHHQQAHAAVQHGCAAGRRGGRGRACCEPRLISHSPAVSAGRVAWDGSSLVCPD